jgi:hypothetical protein
MLSAPAQRYRPRNTTEHTGLNNQSEERATTQFGKATSIGVEYELHCDASLSDKCRKRLVWVMHGPFRITATDRAQRVETKTEQSCQLLHTTMLAVPANYLIQDQLGTFKDAG